VLEVVEPGLLTTVQDGGRPDAVDLGVPIGGACDPDALAMANLLVGSAAGEAVLEMSVVGASFRVVADCVVAVVGVDMSGLARGESRLLHEGERLAFGPVVDATGIRAYLALAGGIDVPEVLGSRSTCLVGGFGGLEGRPLRAGDVIRPRGGSLPAARRWPVVERAVGRQVVRVVRGPDAALLGDAFDGLIGTGWTVSGRGDRQGIRLDGGALGVDPAAPTMLSRGMTWGSIQLPPDGQPIVLLADHQTIGGYPVVAVAITVDRSVLGQLGPGDDVTLEEVSLAEAQQLLRGRAAEFGRIAAALR
jgi:biotin-dependent carboxylase-like uncharacterized protein